MTNDGRAEFFALIHRANRIGALLPERVDDIDLDDPAAVAELKVILCEFNTACAAIAAYSPRAA